jgi:hypothetical protein
MKNAFITAIVLFSLVACTSGPKEGKIEATAIEENGSDGPTMKFKDTAWDFGTISEGERVEHTFKFTNTGKKDLIISSCTASCGCTIPNWPKEPIAPGESGEIKVEFNSAGKSGQVIKDITILSNIEEGKSMLQIKVQVNKKD